MIAAIYARAPALAAIALAGCLSTTPQAENVRVIRNANGQGLSVAREH